MKNYAQPAPAVLLVCNLKGGAGKTTIAVNLACQLQQMAENLTVALGVLGSRSTLRSQVVMVDTDPLGAAINWGYGGSLPVTVEEIRFSGERRFVASMRRLLNSGPDCVVIDTPGHHDKLVQLCMELADVVLVPVTPSRVDLALTASTLDLIDQVRADRGSEKPKCLLVPSRVDFRTGIGRQWEHHLGQVGFSVAPAVQQHVAFVESAGERLWIGQYEPFGAAHSQIIQLAYAVEEDTIRRPEALRMRSSAKPIPQWRRLTSRVLASLRSGLTRVERGPLKKATASARRRRETGILTWTDPDGEARSQPVEVLAPSKSGPRFRLTIPLPVGQTVRVKIDSTKNFKGIIEYCRETREGYDASIRLVYRERRREDRQPAAGTCTVSWVDPDGGGHRQRAGVRNITDEGVQLELGAFVPPHTVVRLQGTNLECAGHASYCSLWGHKYLVGVHLAR